jgi:hypothetical protein
MKAAQHKCLIMECGCLDPSVKTNYFKSKYHEPNPIGSKN